MVACRARFPCGWLVREIDIEHERPGGAVAELAGNMEEQLRHGHGFETRSAPAGASDGFSKPLCETPEASWTLPSWLYTDPAVYELEKERIFYRTWQYVAHETHFPEVGDYVTLRICDQNIFVIRSADGKLRAFHNVCQHRAHELLPDGSGNVERVIVCPYHAWAFETDGRLRGAPRAHQRPASTERTTR